MWSTPRLLLRPTLLNRVLGIDPELLIRRDGLEAAYENLLASNPAAGAADPYDSEYEDTDDVNDERSGGGGGWVAVAVTVVVAVGGGLEAAYENFLASNPAAGAADPV